MPKKILFSDIDGCIVIQNQPINQHGFQTAVAHLSSHEFDLILSSAKTAHEIILLNQKLNLAGPFIVENGAGLLFKKQPPKTFLLSNEIFITSDYYLIPLEQESINIQFLDKYHLQERLITQMSIKSISNKLNLSSEESECAKKRFFSEALYIKDLHPEKIKEIKKIIQEQGYPILQTHSFLHIQSSIHHHKGAAIHYLLQTLYGDKKTQTYAIGDSFNDFSMLNTCNHAYFILNEYIPNIPPSWRIIKEKNFQGWQKAIEHILLTQNRSS